MNLLADEGVDKPIVNALRLAGFNVVYIMETNRGAEDSLILNLANDQQRVLLTQDKDFGELVFRLKQAYYGVVLIRLECYLSTLKAEITVNVIVKYKNELINAFTVIQPNAIRIRK
ncbi:MAG: DUF5615 family PIN-like protein [Ginsengibacter sp.]